MNKKRAPKVGHKAFTMYIRNDIHDVLSDYTHNINDNSINMTSIANNVIVEWLKRNRKKVAKLIFNPKTLRKLEAL